MSRAIRNACLGGANRAAFGLNGDDRGRLVVTPGLVEQPLRDHLFAPERDDQHCPDVRVTAVRRQGVVRNMHVGTQLSAAGQMGKCGSDAVNGRGNSFGHDCGADYGRHNQHMVADANATVRTPIPEEGRRGHAPASGKPARA
jgi:hypothetical protein